MMSEILELIHSMSLPNLKADIKLREEDPAMGIPPYIEFFYSQLKKAISDLKPNDQEYSPEDLQKSILNAMPNHPGLYNEEILIKLDLISQIIPVTGMNGSQLLGEFYYRILDKIRFNKIEQCMQDILEAFDDNNAIRIISTAYALGSYLNELHPDINVKTLQKYINDVVNFKGIRGIAYINLYQQINAAVNESSQKLTTSTSSTKDRRIFIEELTKGLSCFAFLIDDDFIKNVFKNENINKNEKTSTLQPFVNNLQLMSALIEDQFLLVLEEKRLMVAVGELLLMCDNTMTLLKQHIQATAVSDSMNVSQHLKHLIDSYVAVFELQETLMNKKEKSLTKIIKFRTLMKSARIDKALNEWVENGAVMLSRRISCLLSNIKNFGTSCNRTRGMLLFSAPSFQFKMNASEVLTLVSQKIPKASY